MAWKCSLPGLRIDRRSLRRVELDLAAVGQSILAIDHDPLIRGQSLCNDGAPFLRGSHLHVLTFRDIVLVKDINVRAVRSLHHRLRGNRYGILSGRKYKMRTDRLTGPYRLVLISELRFYGGGWGGRFHLVFDQHLV